jgi:hypothetical protein
MEPVHFVVRDQVNITFHVFKAEEVTCHVEHRAAPLKTRDIPYRNSRQIYIS